MEARICARLIEECSGMVKRFTHDLYVSELGDLYGAEGQIIKHCRDDRRSGII